MMEIKTIKDIAKFIRTGKTPPTKEVKYFDGEVNWYTPGDLDKGKYLSTSKRTLTNLAFEDKKAVFYPKNTLIVGCIGDIGKLGITVDDCSSNQQLTGIYPNDDVDVNYLYYWFKGNKSLIDSYANNAVVPILNNRILETIKLPIPPLPQQQKIANILDAADALRQNYKALLAKHDELTQALFLDMFGDPVSNPMRWSEDELWGVLDLITYGLTVRPNYVKEGIPLISAREIRTGEVLLKNAPKISIEDFKKLSDKGLPKTNDILFSKTGSIGHCAIVKTNEIFAITQNAARLTFKKGINVNYAMYYLKSPYIQELSQRRAKGNAVKDLQLGDMKKFRFINPPLSLQNQFAERIQIIEQQKAIAQKSLEKSESLFNSLLQKAFKGEL